MRVFLMACLAFVAIGMGGYFALNSLQKPSGFAYTAASARTDPGWSWRHPTTASQPQCTARKSWQWFFVDFGDPAGEPAICSDSQ
jgi:hypothetical protein